MKRTFTCALEGVRSYAAPFTPPYNVAGAPAISLPLGRTPMGMPIGVQFGAAHDSDRVLLDLALSIETEQPRNSLAPKERWAALAYDRDVTLSAETNVSSGAVDTLAAGREAPLANSAWHKGSDAWHARC
jgi:Amidase